MGFWSHDPHRQRARSALGRMTRAQQAIFWVGWTAFVVISLTIPVFFGEPWGWFGRAWTTIASGIWFAIVAYLFEGASLEIRVRDLLERHPELANQARARAARSPTPPKHRST